MAETRIYEVADDNEPNDHPRLIEASSAAQAVRIAVNQRFSAKIVTPKRVAELLSKRAAETPARRRCNLE